MSGYRLYKSDSEKLGKVIKFIVKKKGIKGLEKACGLWGICPNRIMEICKNEDWFLAGNVAMFHISMNPTFRKHNAPALSIAEGLARKNGNRTVFVKDNNLLDALYTSRIEVDRSALKNSDFDVFQFAAPNELTVDGINIRPFLFGVDCKGSLKGLLKNSESASNTGYVMGIEDPEDPKGENLFSVASWEDIKNNFALISGEQFASSKFYSVHAKLAFSIFLYMRAFPDCVKPGLPDGMSIKEMVHGGPKNKRTGFVVSAPVDRATGTAIHLRRGHFRSLHDKRFKRNEDGTIKIVWVRDTVVGGKIDPYTVEAEAP